jgi:hypothetical protein
MEVIITIICHELGPDMPVSASYNSLFKGLPCNLHQFAVYFSRVYNVFWPVPVTGRSKAMVCERLSAETVVANHTGVTDACLLWMFCVVRRPCDELITRPEESYRVWCVIVRDLEISWMRRPLPTGAVAPEEKNVFAKGSSAAESRCSTVFRI